MLNDLAALYSDNVALFAGSVFVLGLVIGSFSQRRYLPAAHHAGARLARPSSRVAALGPRRRVDQRSAQGGPRTIYLEHASLRLPRLQGAHQGLAEHPGGELAGAAGRCASCNTKISARYPWSS